MKRRKRQDSTVGQFAFFATTTARSAEEEPRRKPRVRPAGPLRSAAPILGAPAPVEAVKTPGNSLKTEMPDRDTLNRLWKESPEALRSLSRMRETNPYVITLVREFCLVPEKKVNR